MNRDDLFKIQNEDLDIKKRMKSVSIMGKHCARFIPDDIETKELVRARTRKFHLNFDEYFQYLGFDGGYDRGKKETDDEIIASLKESEDKDRPGWISTAGDWPAYYERAYSEHMRFREFIKFFGYNVEEGTQESTTRWYACDNKQLISEVTIDADGKYTFDNTQIKNKVANYAQARDIPFNTFLNNLIVEWKKENVFIEPIPHDSPNHIFHDQLIFSNSNIGISKVDDEELEAILNINDANAKYIFTDNFQKARQYNKKIIAVLKTHYKGICQLCGSRPYPDFERDITEAHHIKYFSKFLDNNASNIILVCPNHHRILHKYNATYDRSNNQFTLDNGKVLTVKYDLHLQQHH